jgi:hypothetical protein
MPPDTQGSTEIIQQLVQLRLLVGYLGEHKQSGWWDCDFLGPTGLRFLGTVFPRTFQAAALRSTTEAACLIHDKALGRVGNYHLFRFPPALEDRLEHCIEKLDWSDLGKKFESRDAAMIILKKMANAVVKAPAGPVQVGLARRILTSTAVNELAAHYHSGFEDEIRCFPYFAPEKHAR